MKSSNAEQMVPIADVGVSAPDADPNDHGMPGLALRTAQDYVAAPDTAGLQATAAAETMHD